MPPENTEDRPRAKREEAVAEGKVEIRSDHPTQKRGAEGPVLKASAEENIWGREAIQNIRHRRPRIREGEAPVRLQCGAVGSHKRVLHRECTPKAVEVRLGAIERQRTPRNEAVVRPETLQGTREEIFPSRDARLQGRTFAHYQWR